MKLSKIRFLHIKGRGYKIGMAIGEKQKKEIKYLLEKLIVPQKLLKRAESALPRHEKFFPDFIAELKGIADGAKVDFSRLFAFNCFEDHCRFRNHEEKCTTIFWKNNENKFIGHNEEEFAADYGKLILVKANLDKKNSFLTLNYPGLLCGDTISINSHGIIHAIDTIYPKKEYENGFARDFIGRALLESSSIENSRKIISNFPNFGGLNIMIYSKKEKRGISIETYCRKIVETNLKKSYIHAVHYISPLLKDIPQESIPISIFKIKRVKELINILKESSFKNIKNILSDHLEFPMSICRHPVKKGNLESAATLASVIINLKDFSYYVSNGNPCINKYSKYKL